MQRAKIYSILFLLNIFFSLNSFCQPNLLKNIDDISQLKANLFRKKALFTENRNYSDYELVYQRLDWKINPEIKYIKGAITSYFKILNPDSESIQFDLVQNLAVDSVKHRGNLIGFKHSQDIVEITFNESFNLTGVDSLTIYYKGIPDETGYGSFVQSKHNEIPVIWTLSEPYGARDWWPCKQSLSDKIDSIDIIVTSPELYRTASNGVLISETTDNGNRKMHWKHRFPIATYLVAIAVTNYASYSDFVDLQDENKIEILNYVYPENLESTREKTSRSVEIMELYNELFGVYPFAEEKYGHAQFGWGGGMEHQTMSFMGGFGFDLIAHEMSHQWFGDYITLSSWHDIWLNEGFATWVTGLAYQNLLEGVWWPVWKQQLVERITSDSGGSVYVTDTTSVSRIFNGRLSYSKGAYLLHMLRWLLGDEVLFSAINNYLNDPAIANGFASQQQLVSHLEIESDTSLTEFFNDWYYGEGFPTYSLYYSQNNENVLRINLYQKTSHESVDFFEMPVPVRCYNQNKTDSADFRLNHTANRQEFYVDPGFKVASVKIDPDLWLISKTDQSLGVPWLQNDSDIIIYPNPVKDLLSIFVPSKEEILQINIFNSSGKLLKQISGDFNKIDVTDMPSGILLIQAQTRTKQQIQKIIKL
ncbi:MAG: T9SS type A sorting domain-containing protein [Prolixibacteraceae bacterium]|nr:T9SS type A sorting domain-containing protein [Prolixibacteraceae bacterium]